MTKPQVRDGWDAAAAEMARLGEDRLLDDDAISASRWDETEWEWPGLNESAAGEAGAPGHQPHQPEQPERHHHQDR